MTNQELARIGICNPKHSKHIGGIPSLCTLNQSAITDKKVTVKETQLLATNSIIEQAQSFTSVNSKSEKIKFKKKISVRNNSFLLTVFCNNPT